MLRLIRALKKRTARKARARALRNKDIKVFNGALIMTAEEVDGVELISQRVGKRHFTYMATDGSFRVGRYGSILNPSKA
jgi:hypothetical protein